jgi:hypothetical protein
MEVNGANTERFCGPTVRKSLLISTCQSVYFTLEASDGEGLKDSGT